MGKVIRDVDANDEVIALAELGYFDEEITFYGCVYVWNGSIYYRINENAIPIRHFLLHAAEQSLNPTPVQQLSRREKVPSGKKELIKDQVRAAFLAQMKTDYPTAYFQAIASMAAIMPTDRADALLRQWQKELLANFDEQPFRLLAGAVQLSFEARLLTLNSYRQMVDWINDRFEQINQQNRTKGKYFWAFSGFAYHQEGNWHCFYDANEIIAYRKRWQLLQKGILATPIFKKCYWLDVLRTGDIPKLEKRFGETLKEAMNENYLARIQQIKALPSVIPHDLYQKQQAIIAGMANESVSQAFMVLSLQWNCLVQ